ncbi:ASCH domain-containing protein [Cedecea neteri]|uniref:ASCH domain-containing protein n=1 Tax=Cedecea neteri TaxID=158822 RepID=UPI0028931BF3|nr:ASCH domain-containing protein [Cedecea neteri]WNJ79720.1 ASCH domain-containing protein [Cedecea neteri]
MTIPIILSIRPKYSELIISQKKTIEIRKKIGRNFNENEWVYIYSSSPKKSIVGKFQIEKIQSFSMNSLSQDLLDSSCLSRDEMYEYVGDKIAFAIFIKNIEVVNNISLERLRTSLPSFYPPQSFCYASEAFLRFIEDV